MRLAILLMCHKAPEQVNLLLKQLISENEGRDSVTVFVHLDKKADFEDKLIRSEFVEVLPRSERVNVKWGRVSQAECEYRLLSYATKRGGFDYYWFCSGQDFPIKPMRTLFEFFKENAGHEFINFFPSANNGGAPNHYDKRNAVYFPLHWIGMKFWQRALRRLWVEVSGGYGRTFRIFRRKNKTGLPFYFGSNWACISGMCAAWVVDYIATHPEFLRFYRHCVCPDESFLQTLVMSCPVRGEIADYLHYADWSMGGSNPKILTAEDIPQLAASAAFMARKFDLSVDAEVLKILSKSNRENTPSEQERLC